MFATPRPATPSCFHAVLTDRVFKPGDQLFRGFSGVSFAGYHADIDRMWHLGMPPREILDTYKLTWECNQAMAAAIRPGVKCSHVYAAHATVERRYGVTPRPAGRCGHGYRNSSGLSVHPDNHTILEPDWSFRWSPCSYRRSDSSTSRTNTSSPTRGQKSSTSLRRRSFPRSTADVRNNQLTLASRNATIQGERLAIRWPMRFAE